MKKKYLVQSIFAALLLVSGSAIAEDKYPASDFKPTVVYQDESVNKDSGSTASKPSSSSSASSHDSQYPAANFEPKVVYEDSNYKHSDIVPKSSGNTSNSASESKSASPLQNEVLEKADASSVSSASGSKDDSSFGYVLGLLVLGIAGYVLFKKGSSTDTSSDNVSSSNSSSSASRSSTATGVGRYLLRQSGTGVTRYLDKQSQSSAANATGVAKYLAKKDKEVKSTSDRVATGVEKYMRNKG